MSKKEKLHLSRFTSGYFVSSLKENEKWNNIEQQYKISKEIYEDIEQLQQENQKYKEVFDKAIDKLYCWGEALKPDFQKEMLDILKEVE